MAQLTPAQLKSINDWYSGPMANAGTYHDPSGHVYQQDAQGIYGYDPSHAGTGQSYDRYGADGTAMGQDNFQNPNKMDIGTMIALGLITGGAAGAFSGGLGGVGGFGATATGGANGGVLSKAALDGTTAFGANSVPGAYELGGGASSLGGTFNAAQDSQLFNAANPDALSGYQAAGATPGSVSLGSSAAGSSPGWMDAVKGLLPSGASSLLGPALSLAGAVAGSKGVNKNVTQTQKMDPRLDGAVYGDQGLVPRAQGLLAQQMSPQGQAGYMNMQNVGQGLLSNPMAGNGYAQFAGRKL